MGKYSMGEDILLGVWYVLYKWILYMLRGSVVGKVDYVVKVDYWVLFINSG